MSRIVALGFATMFGLAGSLPAAAADLPKEGKFSVTFFGHGTYKGAAVGKTRSQSIFEYDGYMIGEGLLDHMTAHCMGTGGRTDQTRHSISFCIFTDKDGDQIAEEVDETYPADAKEIRGSAKLTVGTGKYEGISGELGFVNQGSSLRAATDNTFFVYGKVEGSYRLPR